MAVVRKYSYKDWWNGEIYLISSPIVIPPDSRDETLIRVTWNDIIETDIPNIKKKQKDIFNNAVNLLLEIWEEGFSKRYANSVLQGILLNDELDKFENIILAPMPLPNGVYEDLDYCGVLFKYNSLAAIKSYINRTKVNGADPDFDFIHSPNFSFQQKGAIPEVYGECCWQYVQWLGEFQFSSDNNKIKNEDEVSVPSQENENSEPKNPFPMIFKNGHAFNMFLELKKFIVQKETELADYSFIYRQMKLDNLQAINSTVNHTAYIRFLNTCQGAEISSPKLKSSKTGRKEQLYNSVLEKYKTLILDNILGV